jgi:hypothetical protein
VSRLATVAIVLAAIGCGGDPGMSDLGAPRSGPGKADDDDGAPLNYVPLDIHDRGVDPYFQVNAPLDFRGGLQLELVFSAYEPLAMACQIPLSARPRSPLWASIPLVLWELRSDGVWISLAGNSYGWLDSTAMMVTSDAPAMANVPNNHVIEVRGDLSSIDFTQNFFKLTCQLSRLPGGRGCDPVLGSSYFIGAQRFQCDSNSVCDMDACAAGNCCKPIPRY